MRYVVVLTALIQCACANVYSYEGKGFATPAEAHQTQGRAHLAVLQQITPLAASVLDDLFVLLPTDDALNKYAVVGGNKEQRAYVLEAIRADYEAMVKALAKTNIFRIVRSSRQSDSRARYQLRVEVGEQSSRYGTRDVYTFVDTATGKEQVLTVVPGTYRVFINSLLEEMMQTLLDWQATDRKHEFLPPSKESQHPVAAKAQEKSDTAQFVGWVEEAGSLPGERM